MKILLLNDEFYTTGASTAMLRLAERLLPHHELCVMPRIDGEGDIKKKFQALGIPIVDNIKTVDLVVANTLMAGGHVAEAGDKCPCIWWIHEAEVGRNILMHYPQLTGGFAQASQIVLQTTYQAEVYRSFLFDSPAQVHILPFWNNAVYQQASIEPIPKQKKRIVCIGTIEPRKRMEDTILAVDLMPDALKNDVECIFIGKYYQLSDEAKHLVARYPERYQFVGEQPNEKALQYTASADVFVLASESESQPLTIWEAAELEVPICLSALTTYQHVGLIHGQHVLMHQVGSIALLSSNLSLLLTNEAIRHALTKQAKSLLLKRLTRDWGDEFERIIQTAITSWQIKALGY